MATIGKITISLLVVVLLCAVTNVVVEMGDWSRSTAIMAGGLAGITWSFFYELIWH